MMSKETDNFYSKGKRHWENVSATISGMLGGFAKVDKADIRASARFIDGFLKDKECPLRPDYALDCGSGIGRISKHLLLKVFKNIDMVEQNLNFLNESHLYLGEDNCRVLNRYNCGLQDFVPPPNKYDLIWVQWVIGYLKDDDLIRCLQHLKDGLRKNGIIVLKENISNDGQSVEHMDGSITRTRDSLLHIFNEAGLELVSERRQVELFCKLSHLNAANAFPSSHFVVESREIDGESYSRFDPPWSVTDEIQDHKADFGHILIQVTKQISNI